MPNIEIDENELFRLKKLEGTVQSMLKHPSARQKVLQAQKDIDPNVSIPEIDARAPVEAAVADISKKFDAFVASQKAERDKERAEGEKAKFLANFEAGRSRLREQGVTDEGLKAVEDLMTKAGIVDHDIAWAAFSKMNPEPEPAPPAPNFGFNALNAAKGKDPDQFIKAMHDSRGMDESALDKRVHEVLTDIRQQSGVPQQRQIGFGRR